MPWAYWRVRLAQEFHWTFDIVDALTTDDFNQIIAVWDAQAKAKPQ